MSGESTTAAGSGGVGRATLVVSGLTLMSRLTGLVRDAVLAATLGLSVWADIFFLAFLVPNLFRRLFGEGALSSAFIPAYSRVRERAGEAKRFAGAVLMWTAGVTAVLVLVGWLVLWGLSVVFVGSERAQATLWLAGWMLPYMPLVCLVALLGGLLQVHGVFAPAAAVPMVLNAGLITAAVLAGGSGEPSEVAFALSLGVLGAGVLQLAWVGLSVSRRGLLERGGAEDLGEVKAMAVRMLPMAVGLGVFQVNALMDHLIAFVLSPGSAEAAVISWLPGEPGYPIESGSVAALQWSQRLYQFPLGVFGIAVATAAFPLLAKVAGDRLRFAAALRQGLGLSLTLTLPASVGLMLVCEPLVGLIYERGAFGEQATERVAALLLAYGSAVWAYSMTHVLTRGCYALDRPSAPLRVMAWTVPLNLVLNLTLVWPLGAEGLAWSTAIAAMVQVWGLMWVLRERLDAGLLREAGLTVLATVVMGLCVWLVDRQLVAQGDAVRVVVAVVVGMGVYGLVAWPLGLLGLLRRVT
ncbi:murein biosynthesis integral membrane protein MurJ [Mucisphaera sp.]|uniref:murein biosynthesis integral membrane protein MurJ n=1 Tax=Mucisphaera sp. TaxID=2913024 RepID=UPI003D0F843C